MKVEKFVVDLSKVRQQMRDRTDEAFRHVCLRAAENIIVGGKYSPGTPVDTGFARNSWTVGINDPNVARQAAARQDAEDADVEVNSLDEAQLRILGAKATNGDVVYLVSNAVYMRALEFGHSQQAPNGMVRLTMANIDRIAADVASEMGAR